MNFFKALFGGKEEKPEDKKKAEEEKNFDVLKYDGVRALRSGQHDYAIKCFTHALQMKEDLEIRDYMSQAMIRADMLPEAYDNLLKIAEAQPDNIQVYIRMANVCYMMENYTAMGEACEKAILIDPNNTEATFLYARACIGHGDTTNAVAMLQYRLKTTTPRLTCCAERLCSPPERPRKLTPMPCGCLNIRKTTRTS